MTNINTYKQEKLAALRKRLDEINEIVHPETVEELRKRNNELSERILDRRIEDMKKYYDEMVEISKQIAKLEGRKSIFDDEDEIRAVAEDF